MTVPHELQDCPRDAVAAKIAAYRLVLTAMDAPAGVSVEFALRRIGEDVGACANCVWVVAGELAELLVRTIGDNRDEWAGWLTGRLAALESGGAAAAVSVEDEWREWEASRVHAESRAAIGAIARRKAELWRRAGLVDGEAWAAIEELLRPDREALAALVLRLDPADQARELAVLAAETAVSDESLSCGKKTVKERLAVVRGMTEEEQAAHRVAQNEQSERYQLMTALRMGAAQRRNAEVARRLDALVEGLSPEAIERLKHLPEIAKRVANKGD